MLSKNSMSAILSSFGIGSIWSSKQIGTVKKEGKWVPCELTKKKAFWSIIFSYSTQQQRNIFGSGHVTKSRLYKTTRDDQLSDWTNKKLQSTSQSQTCTQKGHHHRLVVCCPSDPPQLSESWWNHCIWEICSANQWDALKTAASTGQQ